MTLPFLRGRGWGGGGDFGFCSPHSKCQTKSYIPQEARASEFPKDEVASPPSLASVPSLRPPAAPHQVSSPQFWPRRPRQAGRRPQAHSSSHCHAAEIRDTSSGWAPAKRFKLKSGKGGPGPQLSLPRVKDAWETSACGPWDGGLKLDMGAGAVTHHTRKTHPPIPRFPKYSSEPQAPDIATSNLHL